MAYDEKLADRVREILVEQPQIEEKQMMGGLAFMVNNKMCVGVIKDELMARIDPDIYEDCLEKHGCHPMDFTGKPMRGWIFVSPEGITKPSELEYWINLAIEFNTQAKKYVKKKSKK
jgi:TfoX/Sxy family transcriptional regulator of competence genes